MLVVPSQVLDKKAPEPVFKKEFSAPFQIIPEILAGKNGCMRDQNLWDIMILQWKNLGEQRKGQYQKNPEKTVHLADFKNSDGLDLHKFT